MKSVYTKYELPGVPELGDSSKTKVLLLFVQGVVFKIFPGFYQIGLKRSVSRATVLKWLNAVSRAETHESGLYLRTLGAPLK